jgi:hypothetical protein
MLPSRRPHPINDGINLSNNAEVKMQPEMFEDFSLLGQWWLPCSPGSKVIGILKFTPIEGGSLDLRGSFSTEYLFC